MSVVSDKEKNENVYKILRKTVTKLKPREKFCILLFTEFRVKLDPDPTALSPPTICYAFMLRGIEAPWKQPIANCLLRDHQNTPLRISRIINDAVHNAMTSGLTVVATVSTANRVIVDAIAMLRNESADFLKRMGKFTEENNETYVVDCNVIHHIYDPCRLLRSFRNHLKDKDLIFEQDGVKRYAAWKAVYRVLALDKAKKKPLQRLRRLGLNHVCLSAEEMMVTSRASQIFSETLGVEMMRAVRVGECSAEHDDTAALLLFIDKLFDTCNADLQYATMGKPYRDPVRSGTVHFQFWDAALKVLDTMRFVHPDTGLVHRPKCLDKWACTIQGLKNVWKLVHKSKIKCLQTRRFNVDVINNMMQILKLLRQETVQFYCESSDAPILDMRIMRLVVVTGYGYYEVSDADADDSQS